MTLTTSLILDLVLAAILLYFVTMGYRRGLILSLCSLLAVVIGLVGGWYLSANYTDDLQARLEPVILERMLDRETRQLQEEQEPQTTEDNTDTGLTSHFSSLLQDQVTQSAQAVQTATARQVAASLSATIARSSLFFLGFVIVPVVWRFVYHGLNLIAKLPGLNLINKTLGGVLGLLKGLVLLLVAYWLLVEKLAWVPAEVAARSYVLPYLHDLLQLVPTL